jgi:hypothetical protein
MECTTLSMEARQTGYVMKIFLLKLIIQLHNYMNAIMLCQHLVNAVWLSWAVWKYEMLPKFRVRCVFLHLSVRF